MERRKRVLIVAVLMGCLCLPGGASAQVSLDLSKEEVEMVKKRREKTQAMREKMQAELGITPEQQKALEIIRTEHRDQIRKHRDTMKSLKEDLKAEMEEVELDTAKIYSIHEQIKALENKMADHRLKGMLQVRDVLTPSQFKKFHDRLGDKRGRREGPDGRPGHDKDRPMFGRP